MPSDGAADTTLNLLRRRDIFFRGVDVSRPAILTAVLLLAVFSTPSPCVASQPATPARQALAVAGEPGDPFRAPVAARADSTTVENDTAAGRSSSADDEAGPVRELVLWFRYAGLVDTYLSALSTDRQLYLPLRELFGLLRIHCEMDLDAAVAHGHITPDEHPYLISFKAGTADIAGRSYQFDERGFIADGGDVYVSPELLEEWFGLQFDLNSGEMALSLRSGDELPIMRMNRRSAHRAELYDPYAAMRHAPLTYDRLRQTLSGGTVDYGLTWSQDGAGALLNVDAAVGAEVLGGDLRWRAAAGHARTAYFTQSEFMWRYVRDGDDLSQIRAGTSYSTGLEPVAYHGVHLTNLPAVPKTYFADYQVAGDAPPDWDVELYLDDRLVGLGTADAAGRYRFTIPISYGTSMIRVKAFGPTGEERHDLQRIQIPFNLLAPGEMRYNVHGGLARNSRRWMTQGDIGYGISERVTVTAGVDVTPRFEAIGSGGPTLDRVVVQKPLPYAGVTSRIGTHYLAGLDVTPGGYSRVSFSGFLPSHASLEVQGIRFARASSHLMDGRRNMVRAGGFIPLEIDGHHASIRVHAARTSYDIGSEFNVGSSVYAGFNRLRLNLAARGEWSDGYNRMRISPTVSYTVPSTEHEILRRLNGMVVTARADYELNPGRIERFHLDVAHNVGPRTRLSVTFDAGLHGAPASVGFRLSADLPTARSTTSARVRSHGSSITHSIRGSVVFDEPNGEFHFDRRPAVGRSSAAVRVFIDEDGNGRFDTDETVLDEDVIRLRHGSTGFKKRAGSLTLLSGLLPYARYTAAIEEGLLSNPMLVPSRPAFSFIADPNSVKPIDIPLTAAGVVEGRVMELRGDGTFPVPGVSVRLVRREDGIERILQTYSDGTFYDMGLPPGTYDIVLGDRSRPDLLVTPSSHTITIKPTVDGEFVEGLDFVLRHEGADPPMHVGDAARSY